MTIILDKRLCLLDFQMLKISQLQILQSEVELLWNKWTLPFILSVADLAIEF